VASTPAWANSAIPTEIKGLALKTVHSITGQAKGHFSTQCSFYLPVKDGKSPKPAEIDIKKAQAYVTSIATDITRVRQKERNKFKPLAAKDIEVALELLDAFADIRPRGHAVVGYENSASAKTIAGKVSPLMRIAYIGPQHKDSIDVLIHEFAHLAGVGEVDRLSVLLDPLSLEPTSIRFLNSGWIRTTSAPVDCRNGKWDWNDPKFILKGHFFEEAMAQLVELRALTATKPILDKPVIFQGKDITFELPIQYGHCAVGWGIIQLERACPGVVKTLIAATTADADYPRLKSKLDMRFPGLFEFLYEITPSSELVVGVERILKCLDSKRR